MATAKGGYVLNKEGLSDMVKDSQAGFLEAYGGAEGLALALKSDPNRGLSTDPKAMEERIAEFGSNYIAPPPIKTYWELILEGLEDNTIQALIFCAVVSLLLVPADRSHMDTSWIEGFAIMVTVLVVLNLQATIEYSKSKEFRRQLLELESDAKVNVVRDGVIVSISPKELLVGDVVRVAVGDVLAVDGVLIEGTDIKLDESALTGEPVLMSKSSKDPFLLSGTNVMTGSGKLLSVAVGLNSVSGRILAAVQGKADVVAEVVVTPEEEEEPVVEKSRVEKDDVEKVSEDDDYNEADGSNLAEKLNILAIQIAKAGLVVSSIIFVLMVVVLFSLPRLNGPFVPRRALYLFQKVLGFFLVAVTILVVAVPEGLPLAVALSLAITMGKLMEDKNRVKHMEACETMGSATTICSDKTGTLTQNKMTVMRLYADGDRKTIEHDAVGDRSVAEQLKDDETQGGGPLYSVVFRELVAQSAALNSAPTSKVVLKEDGQWKYQGNATECALLKMITQLGNDPEAMRPGFQDPTSKLEWGVKSFPFSSERKKMSWVIRLPNGGGFRLLTKGAPSYVCDYATHSLSSDGVTKVPLDKQKCDVVVEEFQRSAMRTLALAYRDFAEAPGDWEEQTNNETGIYKCECDLTLICIVGIEDPLRPTVTKAIQQCNTAGVDVRMCTGDALETAIAISTQCGILRPKDVFKNAKGHLEPKPMFAMTGAEFDERVHELDETKDKVMRRAFDEKSNKVGEMMAFPFQRDPRTNDKMINQPRFDAVWPKLRVLARCQPEDKLTLVRGMRKSRVFADVAYCAALKRDHDIHIFPDHQVVAVTGDGTNDAPALKAANVGFAMGIVGTDIAKQACDIVLLDDNFASTVAAVKWGRNVYDSIAKFCQFQLTVNISAIFVASVGAVCYNESPLGAVQMLWVNVIMDSFASIALASEPPTEDLLVRQPYGRQRPMISGLMWCNMLGQFAYQGVVMCILLFSKSFMQNAFQISCCNNEDGWKRAWSPDNIFIRLIYSLNDKKPDGWDQSQYDYQERALKLGSRHFTIVFNTFVLMQLFNEFNARKLQTVRGLKQFKSNEWIVFTGIFKNLLYVFVVGSTFILQIILVQFTGAFFKVRPLTLRQWGVCTLFGLGALPVQFLINGFIVLFYTDKEEDKKEDPKHLLPTGDNEKDELRGSKRT